MAQLAIIYSNGEDDEISFAEALELIAEAKKRRGLA